MKQEVRERTPEEVAALQEESKRQFTLVSLIAWIVCTAAGILLLVLDFIHDAAFLQILLHAGSVVLTTLLAVMHILRWRELKRAPAALEEDTLDSEDK